MLNLTLRNKLAAILMSTAALIVPQTAMAQLVIDGEEIADAELFEAAKAEGEVVIYGTWPPANQQVLSEAFTKDTGIQINHVRTTSQKLYPRALAEFSAGRLEADFIDLTDLTMLVDLVDKGVLSVEHKVPNWDKIDADLMDPEGRWYTFLRLVQVIGFNTAIVDEANAPTSFSDLLDPKWKDKIGMPGIEVGGSSFAVQAFLKEKIDTDFWTKFATQSPRVYPSVAPTVTDLARGEVEVALSSASSLYAQQQEGGPVKIVFPEEGLPAFPISGGITSVAPHPNAAKLYLNYIVSKRGGEAIARTGTYGTDPDAPRPSLEGLEFPPRDGLWLVSADHWFEIRDPYVAEWKAAFGQ